MKKHTNIMSVQELNDQIFKLFHGLQDGSVKYEYDNLISFGKDFAVKEAIALAEKIMPIIEK